MYLCPLRTVEYLKQTLVGATEKLLALCPKCRQYDFADKVKATHHHQ